MKIDAEKLIYDNLMEDNFHKMKNLGLDGAMTSASISLGEIEPGKMSVADAKWIIGWTLESLEFMHSKGVSFMPKLKDAFADFDRHTLAYKRLRISRMWNAEENLPVNNEIAVALKAISNLINVHELNESKNNRFRSILADACKGRYASASAVIRDIKKS